MFVLIAKYKKQAEEVDRHLEAHKAWIKRNFDAGLFLLTARQVLLVGGLILATGQSEAQMRELIAEDPFFTSGSAEYDVLEFDPVRSTPELESLIRS